MAAMIAAPHMASAETLVYPWAYPMGIDGGMDGGAHGIKAKPVNAPQTAPIQIDNAPIAMNTDMDMPAGDTTTNTTHNDDRNYDIIPDYVGTNLNYSKMTFDRQDNVTNKAVKQLQARQDGTLKDNYVTIGGRYIGTIVHERSNTDGKFPILSRIPPQHTKGDSATEDLSNDTSLNATVTLPYVTGFIQGEHTDVEYPGQDQTQMRKAFVTIGDLDKAPVYATIGKKTVDFGKFESYAPITHNHSSHYFWSQTDQPLLEVGYVKNGTHLSASLIKNDRGLRVLNSPENDGKYENFALNASQELNINDQTQVELGGGFLRGTIYDSAIAHHPPATGADDRTWNGAWTVNGRVSYENIDVQGEFTQTTDKWPATDHKVSALTAQARYKDEVFDRPTVYSVMYSQGIQGADDAEWHDMEQLVVGGEIDVHPHVKLTAEYLYNEGFVPLILPTIAGDEDVKSHTFIVGTELTF